MIYADYEEFRAANPLQLKVGGLYKVRFENSISVEGVPMRDPDGRDVEVPNGEIVLCCRKPYKRTYKRAHHEGGSVVAQYWTTPFLYNEKLADFVFEKSPLNYNRYLFEVHWWMEQITL